MSYELIFPVDDANKALRDGKVDFVGGSAHSTLAGFRNGRVLSLSAPFAGYVLVSRRGRISRLRWVILTPESPNLQRLGRSGLRALLKEEGIDPDTEVNSFHPRHCCTGCVVRRDGSGGA